MKYYIWANFCTTPIFHYSNYSTWESFTQFLIIVAGEKRFQVENLPNYDCEIVGDIRNYVLHKHFLLLTQLDALASVTEFKHLA